MDQGCPRSGLVPFRSHSRRVAGGRGTYTETDPEKAVAIEAWIDQLAAAYEVIPMDASMFREWARLMVGKSDHLIEDAMIAATARVRGLVVATRNAHDFEMFRVEVFNPFTRA
jgi:predicted nucleic acid-binding protein